MTVLITGVAGFIGFHLAKTLLDDGRPVIGIDNLNDYYDPNLKRARLAQLEGRDGFTFHKLDIADREVLPALFEENPQITHVTHLAAQAGVRYSLINPYAYADTNLMGHLVILESCRRLPKLQHLVYASSSSVYGGNTKLPFSVEDPVNRPVSLYAATKRANELMAECYGHLFGLPMTGLRFFTVYGPWGRPDMSAYIFTKAIFEGTPIQVFNHGDMRRDFTYIDDIVAGVIAAMAHPPKAVAGRTPHQVYNLGNHRSEELMHFIELLERSCNKKAIQEMAPMQPGDVQDTYADIEASRRDLGFDPKTAIAEGLPRFVQWYREYHGV